MAEQKNPNVDMGSGEVDPATLDLPGLVLPAAEENLDEDPITLEPESARKDKPTSVKELNLPRPQDGKNFSREERAKILKTRRTHEVQEAMETEEERVVRETNALVGTDEQLVSDPGAPPILVTQDPLGVDMVPTDCKMLTIYLPQGKYPITAYEGDWTASDLMTVLSTLRRSFRRYQLQLQRQLAASKVE